MRLNKTQIIAVARGMAEAWWQELLAQSNELRAIGAPMTATYAEIDSRLMVRGLYDEWLKVGNVLAATLPEDFTIEVPDADEGPAGPAEEAPDD